MTEPETAPADPATSPAASGMTEKERATLYVEMWKQTVTVQQHFNDIEWRIRGLALTAATFSVGAAGLAVNNDHPFPAGVILGVGLVLWYAFYFVDRYWYHPLLVASVKQGHQVEAKIEECGLPDAALTKAISAGSPIDRPTVIRALTRTVNKDTRLRSEGKLMWFYGIGAAALGAATVGFLVAALYGSLVKESPEPKPIIVKIDAPTATAAPKPESPIITTPKPRTAP
jgi:hypothetical protein